MKTGQATSLDRIRAVARRDWAVRRSYQFDLAFRMVGLLSSVATFFFISKLVGDAPALEDVRYFEFALIGLLVINGATVAMHSLKGAIAQERADGTLEMILSKPVPLWTVLTGSLVVPTLFYLAEVVLMLSFAVVLGSRFPLGGLLVAMPLLILTLVAFAIMGLFAVAFIVLTKRGEPITFVILQGTTLLAGAVFPAALLPAGLEVLARFIPAFYGLNGLRAAMLEGAGLFDVIDEIAILCLFIVVLAPVALWVLNRALRIARVAGTLGSY